MSKVFRAVYEFALPKKEFIDVPAEGTGQDGSVITGTKKEEREIAHHFAIKKPSRIELEKADLFYSKNVGEYMQAGLISGALLAKRFGNDGGIFTDKERKELADLKEKLRENNEKLEFLQKKTKDERSEDEEAQIKAVHTSNFELGEEIRKYIIAESNLFENTAESKARTKLITWFNLELLYRKDGNGNYHPIFESDEDGLHLRYNDKIDKYDSLLDQAETDPIEHEFWQEVFSKCIQIVSICFYQGWHLKADQIDETIKSIMEKN